MRDGPFLFGAIDCHGSGALTILILCIGWDEEKGEPTQSSGRVVRVLHLFCSGNDKMILPVS